MARGYSKIGVLVERQRSYGRRICKGAAAYACDCGDISLGMLEWNDLDDSRQLAQYDAFVARVLDDRTERALRDTRKPVVDVFFAKPRKGFGVVDSDHAAIGVLAAEHFISRGFRNFAYFGYEGIRFSDVRRETFVRTVERAGHACHVFGGARSDLDGFSRGVVRSERYEPRSGEARTIRSWLGGLPKPIAILCSHDLRAHHLLTVCQKSGISVPNEVAILGEDNDALLCGFTTPTLSSIDPDAYEIGRMAVKSARDMLMDPAVRAKPPVLLVKPRELIVRGSTEVYPVDPPWLSDAMVYICRNAAKGASATDVFKHVGLSHTTVSATFRRKLGMSVQDMLSGRRLEEACRLLSGGMSITAVARNSGFSSVQYFCRSFAARHGMTPAAWQAANCR